MRHSHDPSHPVQDAILVGSFPTSDGRGWIGLGRRQQHSAVGVSVFAICAD